jgi:acyl-CoA thioester hydrolase
MLSAFPPPPDSRFRHATEIFIRYGDIDMLQHVNNAAYLAYLEEARIAYAKEVMGWDGQWNTLDMIVAKITVEYKTPLFLGDRLYLYTRCSRIGNKSFELEYIFARVEADGSLTPAATAHSVMVAYDVRKQLSTPVNNAIRESVSRFEGENLTR